eukprot:COSAG02_NODE_31457_length_533_cov_0.875576_1_plen_46_part_10
MVENQSRADFVTCSSISEFETAEQLYARRHFAAAARCYLNAVAAGH